MRILVAEDERDLNRVIQKKLKAEGYSVDGCFDGDEAVWYLKSASYDAAILDIMMPQKDGYQVLEEIRREHILTPILFLTAKDAIEDRVKGLDMGASDYVIKPFSFEELMARLRAMTRQVISHTSNTYTLADLSLNTATHKVMRGDKEITLTAKEYALLEVLLRNKNTVLSRARIEESLWDFDYGGGTNVIDVYIRYLRKKLDDPFENKLIHTVRGVGYVLREDT